MILWLKSRRIWFANPQGQLNAALEGLLNVEKQQRLAEDITGTKLACLAIIEVLYAAKDWKLVNEHILLLAKRRSQLKQVCHLPLVVMLQGAAVQRQRQALQYFINPVQYLEFCDFHTQACSHTSYFAHLYTAYRHEILQVVQAFVRQSMGYIEQTPDKESKLELIKTLQTVTEGKVIYCFSVLV